MGLRSKLKYGFSFSLSLPPLTAAAISIAASRASGNSESQLKALLVFAAITANSSISPRTSGLSTILQVGYIESICGSASATRVFIARSSRVLGLRSLVFKSITFTQVMPAANDIPSTSTALPFRSNISMSLSVESMALSISSPGIFTIPFEETLHPAEEKRSRTLGSGSNRAPTSAKSS